MSCSQIAFDSSLSELATVLARIARGSPDRALLERAFAAMEAALGRVERALELGGLGLAASAHDAYLAALMAGSVVAAVTSSGGRVAATPRRLLSTLEPLVTSADRALAARVLPCLQ